MTSVEFVQTSKGDLVSLVKGVQTCSFIEPQLEGQSWVEHYLENIRGRRTLVVLGIGSGYHIEALVKSSDAQILAIEKQPVLIESFKKSFSQLVEKDRVQTFGLDDQSIENLLHQVKPPFSVLTFAPTAYLDLSEFRAVYDVLCGRESVSLLSGQFKMRGIQDFFMSTDLNLKSPSESYRKLAKEQSLSNRWKNVFKMMGELIR